MLQLLSQIFRNYFHQWFPNPTTYQYLFGSFYLFSFLMFYWSKAYKGVPDSSVGKESTCNAGDPGSISGSGRFPGEGICYPLQHFWASLVAQLVNNLPAKVKLKKKKKKKNLPAMWETWPRKGQFSFHSQRKVMPKNAQTTSQLHSSHTLAK